MTYFNCWVCGGLAQIRRKKVAYYILANNYFEIQLSSILVDCFCRGSYAINNEHFMRMFCPMFSI